MDMLGSFFRVMAHTMQISPGILDRPLLENYGGYSLGCGTGKRTRHCNISG